MIANDYPLGFKVALHRKDLGIALDLAREMGADLPVAELAADFETDLVAGGHADDDMSALARVDPRRARACRELSRGAAGRRPAATPPPTPTSSIGSPSLPS